MPAADLGLLEQAARAAGRIALRYFGNDPEVREKAGGLGPVSAADLEIDAMLCAMLCGARPDYGWLSEESEDAAARLERRRVFIVDPIDGTRDFLAGGKAWSHALAVADAGRIVAAAVYLPRLDRLYTAAEGAGARMNGAPIAASPRVGIDGATLLATRRDLDPRHWRGAGPPVERQFRPSLAYRMCLVAEGQFDAMLTLRDTWEWDLAAGTLICAEAGATVTTRAGDAPRYNQLVPVLPGAVAAGPGLHAALLGRLAPEIPEL